MWPFLFLLAAGAGIAYLVKRDLESSSGDVRLCVTEVKPVPAPPATIGDWTGWVWPVPDENGRTARITQEYKPGHDPKPGEASGEHANHLGVDIMYGKLATDPPGKVKHDASTGSIAPPGTKVVATGPGKIWLVSHSDFYGTGVTVDHGTANPTGTGMVTFYQHLGKLAKDWHKGDPVAAGEILGDMGYAPGDPEGLRHLHFEIWFPRTGVPGDEWRINPEPYMRRWKRIELPPMVA